MARVRPAREAGHSAAAVRQRRFPECPMKRISSLAAALVLALGLCGTASAAPLVVAHDTNFKPFEFKDESC